MRAACFHGYWRRNDGELSLDKLGMTKWERDDAVGEGGKLGVLEPLEGSLYECFGVVSDAVAVGGDQLVKIPCQELA